MNKYTAIALVLLMSALFAQGPGGFGRGMGWNDELNLTTEQIKQIESFRNDFRKEQIDLRADVQKMRIDLQELLRSDNPDQKAIDKMLDRIQEKETAMEKLRIAHHLQVRGLLTDEQKVLFDQHSFGAGKGHRGKGRFGRSMDGDGPRQGRDRRGGHGRGGPGNGM